MKRLMLLCGLVALFAVSSASAGASKSFTINQTGVAYGDTVTFSYSGYNAVSISVECFKQASDGSPIASESVYWASQPVGSSFVLTGWDGSPVLCQAALLGHRQIQSVLKFQVTGT